MALKAILAGAEDLVQLSGVPGVGAGLSILSATYEIIGNIKVYKQQCLDMSNRCVGLLLALRDSSVGLEGHRASEYADEITLIIASVDRKINDWAQLNLLKSFLQQTEIKSSIDRLHRDIDSAMVRFNVKINMELARNNAESRAILARDKAEMREVLQTIVKSTEDMKTLLNMQSPAEVEGIMESLQTELSQTDLPPSQERTFREGLWWLHEKTSKLPPLPDLTGQVTDFTGHVAAKGSHNDIFKGTWLGKEDVALRVPRAVMNSPQAKKHLQREVAIWRSLDHCNVVPLYGIVYIEQEVYTVSPWMDNGTAIEYVQAYPQVDKLRMLSEVADGLEYLHSNGVVHGDLRGANVLISRAGVARLSDFGMSKFLEDCGQGMTSSPGVNPRWFAPELLRQSGPLSTSSDVYSFAMVCLELMTGMQPFHTITRDITVMRDIDQGKIPDRPGRQVTNQGLTDELWSFLKKCWSKKPELRPSISEVKQKLLEIRGLSEVSKSPGTRRPSWLSIVKRPSSSGNDSVKSTSSPGGRPRIPFTENFGGQIREEPEQHFYSPSGSRRPGSAGTDSTASTTGTRLRIPFAQNVGGNIQEEPEQLSAISIRAANNTRYQIPQIDFGDNSVNSTLSPVISVSPPYRQGTLIPPSPSRPLPQLPRSPSSDLPSPIRSAISRDSSFHMSGPLLEAVTDPRPLVIYSKYGTVSSGTLEGLVERLINNFNLRKDLEYRDVLLTGCTDFTTPEDFFAVLARRFHDAEVSATMHPEDRVATQYNIFTVITYWLSSRRLHVDPQLLWQMNNFCYAALQMKNSQTMNDKAKDLLRLIEDRSIKDQMKLALSLAPGRKLPRTSEISPRHLAIALTLLEGDRYKAILPTDYMAHLRRHGGLNNVDAACATSNKIGLWVKQSILYPDDIDSRAEVMKFFVNAAQECLELRNFASLTTISTALHSAPIERLRLTRGELPISLQHKLDDLEDVLDPHSNHRSYRDVLNQGNPEARLVCVPWIAVHLRELHQVLHQHPPVVFVDNKPLINFERYIKFTDRIKEVLHYTAPDLERYRQQGELAYLENQLRNVVPSTNADIALMERSRTLEVGETRDIRYRKRELRRLGFRA